MEKGAGRRLAAPDGEINVAALHNAREARDGRGEKSV